MLLNSNQYPKGSCTNHVDSHGGGGQWNVHFTNKAYLVKLSTKGEGGQKSSKNGSHGLCMPPNTIYIVYGIFMYLRGIYYLRTYND